jgi:hypothetical protein
MGDEKIKPEDTSISTSTSMDEPSYEEDEKLDQTMMDIDAKKFMDSVKNKQPSPDIPPEEKDEPLEDLLKKKKSILGKIFHK